MHLCVKLYVMSNPTKHKGILMGKVLEILILLFSDLSLRIVGSMQKHNISCLESQTILKKLRRQTVACLENKELSALLNEPCNRLNGSKMQKSPL